MKLESRSLVLRGEGHVLGVPNGIELGGSVG